MMTFAREIQTLLAEVSRQDALSADCYKDGRLTAVLNIECATRLIREILDDEEALWRAAKASYTHSNGFDKIALLSSSDPEFKLRLHVWWPKEQGRETVEYIHNHRWLFRSVVLTGSLSMEIYTERETGPLMYQHEYHPRDESTEKYDLKVIGRLRLAADLTIEMMPGSTYAMSPSHFHRVRWLGNRVLITMFARWRATRQSAVVYSETAILEEQVSSVPSFTADQLRTKLRSVLNELSYQRPNK